MIWNQFINFLQKLRYIWKYYISWRILIFSEIQYTDVVRHLFQIRNGMKQHLVRPFKKFQLFSAKTRTNRPDSTLHIPLHNKNIKITNDLRSISRSPIAANARKFWYTIRWRIRLFFRLFSKFAKAHAEDKRERRRPWRNRRERADKPP